MSWSRFNQAAVLFVKKNIFKKLGKYKGSIKMCLSRTLLYHVGLFSRDLFRTVWLGSPLTVQKTSLVSGSAFSQGSQGMCILVTVLCTVHCALCCTLCTVHCSLCTANCELCTVHCALSTVNCELCTVHCALCTVYCTVHGEL